MSNTFLLAQDVAAGVMTAQGRIDVVAVAGILGTLIGTAIGALVTLRVQRMQQEHTDRTRFHAERLKVYGEFNAASNAVMAGLAVGNPVFAETAEFLRSFETLRLIGSEPVSQAATTVHAIVGNALAGEIPAQHGQWQTCNAEMGRLCAIVRNELGVTPRAV